MKHKILITALIAIGFSLSGASHALSVLKPDGTRAVANVEGNKLMLRDATGKLWLLASDGTYKTDDGRTLYVKGGIIGAQRESGGRPRSYVASRFGLALDTDNKAKAGVIAPMKQSPDKLLPAVQPAAPGMGSPAATRGGLLMDKPPDKPSPPKPDKMLAPSMGSPAATQRGLLMESDKPGNEVKPGPKPDKTMTPSMGSPAATRATPMPQGTQGSGARTLPNISKPPLDPEGSPMPSMPPR